MKNNVLAPKRLSWNWLHIDPYLLLGLLTLALFGLFILYSAGDQSIKLLERQGLSFLLGFTLLIVFAQIPPRFYNYWSPWLYAFGVVLLLGVLLVGHVGQGARRWLTLGPIRFQPSELMKIALPMGLAWFFQHEHLPPKLKTFLLATIGVAIPFLLTAKQPDLGTAIIIGAAGVSVIIFAGLRWRSLLAIIVSIIASLPVLWHFMHQYQKNRVLTFLDPERAPLSTGYHIIQSKIAIGSGGIFGKGWLHGTQSHLSFLPAHSTDFIFAVSGEELGLIGCVILLLLFILIFLRCLYISASAQNTYNRLLSGSLSVMFILSACINIGMVIGILPVVGVPLPLVSYGGTSMITMMTSFGIIMSIHTHRRLWNQ